MVVSEMTTEVMVGNEMSALKFDFSDGTLIGTVITFVTMSFQIFRFERSMCAGLGS